MGVTSTITASAVSTATQDANPMGNSDSSLVNDNQRALSVPAILGITLAVVFSVIGIIVLTVCVHGRRRQAVGRAKRKSIMDAEFAASKIEVQHIHTQRDTNPTAGTTNVGYFDMAKPLPTITKKPVEDDRLSRSSTIIADAAEIAQINRKASNHQQSAKKQRGATRERNHALQILVTNAENNTSEILNSPLASNPTTPVDPDHDPNSPIVECTDNDGDPFVKRPSRI